MKSAEQKFFAVLGYNERTEDYEIYGWQMRNSTDAHMRARECAVEHPGSPFYIAEIVGYHEAPKPVPVFTSLDNAPMQLLAAPVAHTERDLPWYRREEQV